MIITENLKKRFCKDHNISLQIFVEPYFTDRIKLMGYYQAYQDFVQFVDMMFANDEEYFAYYNELKDNIINYIKNSETFNKLNTDDMNKYPKLRVKQGDTYKESNVGDWFISIDMRKANFSALVAYGLNHDCPFFESESPYSWESFMRMFTPYMYFTESKYIRQVVFGNCNASRQIAYESYLMSQLATAILEKLNLTESVIYSLNSDEIIFRVSDINVNNISSMDQFCDEFTALVDSIAPSFPIKIDCYQVGRIDGTDAYVKYHVNGHLEFKCVNPYDAPFIYRFMESKPIEESDMYFMHDGKKLARFVEAPNLSLRYKQKSKED